MSGVWIFVENRDGAVSTISKEVLGAARLVADDLGQDLDRLGIWPGRFRRGRCRF